MRVFTKADEVKSASPSACIFRETTGRPSRACAQEDAAGLADKSTARTYYAAGMFFDVLKQFPDLEPQIEVRGASRDMFRTGQKG
jgi:hypothetical protein